MEFIKDECSFEFINISIKLHDISKLGKEEFDGYRKSFFPTDEEEYYANSVYGCSAKHFFKEEFDKAWEHHKSVNKHHWQNWTKGTSDIYTNCHIVEMICDWMAMGMKFGDTAQSYYEGNKDKIDIPKNSEEFMYEIFGRL